MSLMFISYVFENLNFLYFYILSHLFSFWNKFSPPPYSPIFFIYLLSFPSPQTRFHKPYPLSKIFLNIRAVTSFAVLCNNVVLITTPIFSKHFFNFFNVLTSAPTTTGMTKSSLLHFPQHLLDHVHTIFQFFSDCISHIIPNELSLQHYIPFVPTFHICQQYGILFDFSYDTYYKLVIGLFYLPCVSYSLFEFSVSPQDTTWLLFQLSSQLFSVSSMFLFYLLFLAFLSQTVHTFFWFSIFPSFYSSNSV